ncbi:MAG: hypothetical protein ACFE78_13175 [Candidatus Hodarchaeota archaeon]
MIDYIFLVIFFIIAIVEVFGDYKYNKKSIKQKINDIKRCLHFKYRGRQYN